MSDGTAQSKFPIGTEIPDTYNGRDNPLIVGTYQTVSGKLRVGLVRKFVDPTGQPFGTSGVNYDSSGILTFLNSTYLDNCSDELKAVVSEVTVPYIRANGNTFNVSGKWHLLSGIEVCGTYNAGEGQMWELWKQRTKLTTASDAANSGRIGRDRNGSVVAWWLRSKYSTSAICRVNNAGLIGSDTPTISRGVLPCCWITT